MANKKHVWFFFGKIARFAETVTSTHKKYFFEIFYIEKKFYWKNQEER